MKAFDTILVANRGEIALRVMRTTRRLGYRCVAVYSDADAGAPHCAAGTADGPHAAMRIGGPAPSDSYLNIPALIAAAQASGAGAVHPGYGFLAESAQFAQACADAGLAFIGPPPAAIEAMGNKAGAKRLMLEAGVPCVPGYQGADQSDERMVAEAGRIGFPVMIKAAAGGGGRGMRRVDDAGAFGAALASARSEAQHAFGSAEVILERAILAPRHIEIQVFADSHGNVVHMGERDCSVQRRHQKLIEEAPSPAVPPALRERMGAVAVAAARAIGYVGAGTLEFLLDRDGAFYFMEMNTRLQVEHAVTEAITGIDLVEWQLLVAAGAPLPLQQAELDARRAAGGHAIEVRLCAEDPAQDFLPQSGKVLRWTAPDGVRCDHALGDGVAVPPWYDSMLAKLVAHGRDRADALRRMRRALDECILLGLPSNRAFLAQCLAHPAFVEGQASTGFIAQHLPPERRTIAATPARTVLAASAMLAWHRSRRQERRYPGELQGWCSSHPYSLPLRFTLDGAACQVRASADGSGAWRIASGSGATPARVDVAEAGTGTLQLSLDGRHAKLHFVADGARTHFLLDGVEHTLDDLGDTPPRKMGMGMGAAGGRIEAPMSGRVVSLHVAQGDKVSAGQPLLALEAMKMEHNLLATRDGTVAALGAALGMQVATGQLLLEITT
ncbi:geranyl-CoA carboxylase alpha subunit [Duganella sp. CF458]|uniref:acetyl/propionyl/methylcrotonyl-CoA carboxylase subunit alpha n=1 Tax=Duganella sp. CF458 TaxID=1884368 RepID=UPI0008E0F6D1|nr:biotin carboxylase N-terminal domain-containing protein [Duganella sp. CF458]SFG96307.1 geranyl-CoA carboxylase alpha subunit [Duganella sp. CF458]